jgi:hypothetical protein
MREAGKNIMRIYFNRYGSNTATLLNESYMTLP